MGKQLTIILFFCSILFGVTQLSQSQTIPKQNLNLFLGKVTSDPDSTGRYEFSQFDQWCYDTITDGRRWSWNMPYDGYWLSVDTNSHDAALYALYPTYRFFLMHDVNGHGGKPSILTTWKDVGNDSIQFICAHRGYYGGGLAMGTILRAGIFPDSSFYLCVSESFGDGGDFALDYTFLRGTLTCQLQEFYSTFYDESSDTHYNYEVWLHLGDYQILETSIYVSLDSANLERDYPSMAKKADSVSIRIIDLWQLAKEKFGIK